MRKEYVFDSLGSHHDRSRATLRLAVDRNTSGRRGPPDRRVGRQSEPMLVGAQLDAPRAPVEVDPANASIRKCDGPSWRTAMNPTELTWEDWRAVIDVLRTK